MMSYSSASFLGENDDLNGFLISSFLPKADFERLQLVSFARLHPSGLLSSLAEFTLASHLLPFGFAKLLILGERLNLSLFGSFGNIKDCLTFGLTGWSMTSGDSSVISSIASSCGWRVIFLF